MSEPSTPETIAALEREVLSPSSATRNAAERAAVQRMSPEQVQQEILLELMGVRRLLDRVSCGGNAVVVTPGAL